MAITGTIGHIGTSSFYPPHHITMGEGGAVYTNDSRLKKLVESFQTGGVTVGAHQVGTIHVVTVLLSSSGNFLWI